MNLYHFTDTVRLPWILQAGELRPGQNSIADMPNPDFLWATSNDRGDATASYDQGNLYRSGLTRFVRFTVPAHRFFPWSEAESRSPRWTAALVAKLEKAAAGKSSPFSWWCCEKAISLQDCAKIETRSYADPTWRELDERPRPVRQNGDVWLAIRIGRKVFASREVIAPDGLATYNYGTMPEAEFEKLTTISAAGFQANT